MRVFLTILVMQLFVAFDVMGWELQSITLKNKQVFAAFAQEVNNSNVYMSAEQMLVYTKDTKVILSGRAQVKLKNITLMADKIQIFCKGFSGASGGFGFLMYKNLNKFTLENGVMIYLDDKQLVSDYGTYDIVSGIVNLEGNVIFTEKNNTIKALKAIYNMNTQNLQIFFGKIESRGTWS